MVEKPIFITLAGKKVPLWCDIFVLNELQEEFESIGEFERKLLGVKEVGEGKFIKTEPDMRAIMAALPVMIREGIRKMESIGEPVDIKVDDVLLNADMPFILLAGHIHDAYKRCFVSKNKTRND